MKLNKIIVVFFMVLANFASAFDVAKDNLSKDKAYLSSYLHSGRYLQDVKLVAAKALLFLKQEVKGGAVINPAIVLDIDSTVLSDLYLLESYGFGGNQQIFDNIVKSTNLVAISPVVELYQWAVKHDVAVFFVTGRPNVLKSYTINNLHKYNIDTWQEMFFWSKNSQLTVGQFKASVRQQIIKSGYVIVLNLGDQNSDLEGGFAKKSFKLPNPFYLIPSELKRAS